VYMTKKACGRSTICAWIGIGTIRHHDPMFGEMEVWISDFGATVEFFPSSMAHIGPQRRFFRTDPL
jgi:hypothetical protein